MTDTSPRPVPDSLVSPPARRASRPSWLDTRLVLGVALVLGAVLLGATVVARADHRSSVWSLSHDVAAGTVLAAEDLRPEPVQLGSAAARYVPSTEAVVGRAVTRAMSSGELLSRNVLVAPATGVTVTIPVRPENAPKLERGQRITVWVSAKTCRGVVVLSGVPVQDIRQASGSSFGSSGELGVVVTIAAADAQRVVWALDVDGALVRVGVLAPGEMAAQAQDPSICAATR